MKAVRVLQWATVMAVVLTIGFEVHGYWLSNPKETCASARGDTYLQVRACTLVITLADIEGNPNAGDYIVRGEAEETNCDLHDASFDYRHAVDISPASHRDPKLAMHAVEVEREYCSRGENADRATGVVLYGALIALPYALIGVALIGGLFWLASKRLLTSLLLTLSSISWLVALFAVFLAMMTFYWHHHADYIPEWLAQETLFEERIITPLWCVLIGSWLTFSGFRTWPRSLAESEA